MCEEKIIGKELEELEKEVDKENYRNSIPYVDKNLTVANWNKSTMLVIKHNRIIIENNERFTEKILKLENEIKNLMKLIKEN